MLSHSSNPGHESSFVQHTLPISHSEPFLVLICIQVVQPHLQGVVAEQAQESLEELFYVQGQKGLR